MRIRTIKPEFWVSESIGKLSREARLLFIGLWSFADDSGRGRGALPAISGSLFPYDSDAVKRLPEWFSELEAGGMVRRYIGEDGNTYYDIPKWLKHQKIEKPSASKFPPFAEGSPNIPRIFPEGSPLEQGTGNREQGPMEQGTNGAMEQDCASAPASREAKAKREKFHPPTIEECKTRAAELNLPAIEADKFLSYYQSNGWKVGRNPMKCWKAAMATWAANWASRGNPGAKPAKDWYQGSVAQRRNLEMGYTDEMIAENTRRRQEIIDAQEREFRAEIAAKAASVPVGASELPGLGDEEGGT